MSVSFQFSPKSFIRFTSQEKRLLAQGLLSATECCHTRPGTRSWREQNPLVQPLGPITIFLPCLKARSTAGSEPSSHLPSLQPGAREVSLTLNACQSHWPWRAWIDAPKNGCHLSVQTFTTLPGLRGCQAFRELGSREGMDRRNLRGAEIQIPSVSDLSSASSVERIYQDQTKSWGKAFGYFTLGNGPAGSLRRHASVLDSACVSLH